MYRQEASKVLLVCIYDTILFQVTNQMIYELFKPCKQLKKVLIFEKGQITKCFVEFYSVEDGISIKNGFDGKKMFQNYCKMHIYYSNLKQVDLKNENSKGRDFSNSSITDNSSKKQQIQYDKYIFESFTEQIKRYKSLDNDKQLSMAIHKLQVEQSFDQKIKSDILTNILDQDKQTQSQIHQIKKIHQKLSTKQSNIIPSELLDKNNTLMFYYQHQISINQVYNLFSNFGNIQKIIKKYTIIYIQFSNTQFATLAKDYLNNTVLYGNVLRLKYADNKQLIQKPKQYRQSIVYDISYHRYNSKKSISLNPPSNTLHVSNMKKQTCNQASLKKMFSQFGKVDKISIISVGKERNMALVKMTVMEQAFNALAGLHNFDVNNRRLQISFTKSRI